MGIRKCDSSSQPRTSCGIALYKMNGSKRFTWLHMKKQVRFGSKPGDRTTRTRAPENSAMRRQKPRCSQSCLRGSRKIASAMRMGTKIAKCSQLRLHRASCAGRPRLASYIDVQRSGENIEAPDPQRGDLAVNHDVHRIGYVEFDVPNGAARCKRVFRVRTIIQLGQIAEQAEAADRTPANELDKSIRDVGVRSDQHFAAGVLGIVESKKEHAAFVPVLFVVASEREGAPAQRHNARKNAQQIAKRAERLQAAIGERRDIGCEAQAEKVEGNDLAFRVLKAQQVHRPRPSLQ